MTPRVVFGLQAPTLLNILATAPDWQLEVVRLGSEGALSEHALLAVPEYQGGAVAAAFVCHPHDWAVARCSWPRARLFWVAHNGLTGLVPELLDTEHVLCFSDRVAGLQRAARPGIQTHVVRPTYTPQARWRWGQRAWSELSRPASRRPEHGALIDACLAAAGGTSNPLTLLPDGVLSHTTYGQDQPAGFLEHDVRERLYQCSAAFVSCQAPWAGFGLAEHQCLAAGVPIIGTPWGDMQQELGGAYGLSADTTALGRKLRQLVDPGEGPRLGAELSELGLDMIAHCRTAARMREGIGALLSSVP